MKRNAIRRRLEDAMLQERLVWLTRKIDGKRRRGFVVGVGEGWVLLHSVPNATLRLNGYFAVPVASLAAVAIDDSFAPTTLRLRGERPRPQPDLLLVDLPGLLSSAATVFPLAGLWTRGDDYLRWVGRVAKLGRRSVRLHALDRDATWYDAPKIAYRSVTQVELGDGYLDGLWLVAGGQRREAQ